MISIAPGIYPEQVTISDIVTESRAPLTLRGVASETVIDARGKSHAVFLNKQQYVILEGLTLRNAEGFGNLFIQSSANNPLRNCVIADARKYDGVTISGGVNTVIEHCVFYGNRRAGVFLTNSSNNAGIRFNIFSRNGCALQMDQKFPSLPIRSSSIRPG